MSENDIKIKPDLLNTIAWDSESDDDRPLSSFVSDRVKLMRKIFKRINSKRITQMAPKCLKEMPLAQMKSVLLDELMGMSNKRLTSVINNAPDASKSSSSSEDELSAVKPDDVISLDDITDDSSVGIIDDNCMEIKLSERERLEIDFEIAEKKHKRKRKKSRDKNSKKNKITIKTENSTEIIETIDSVQVNEIEEEKPVQDDPFVSALNLLELQARARAIRSQLLNEIILDDNVPTSNTVENNEIKPENISNPGSPNSVVILSPQRDIVEIDESSHSESEKQNDSISKQNGDDSIQEKENDKNMNGQIEDTKETEENKENNKEESNNDKETVTVKVEKENGARDNGDNVVSTSTVEDDDVLIMNEDDDMLI